jgi:Cu(I)/Ag(I) efflux system protein CusF
MNGRGARFARVLVLGAALAACGGVEAGQGEGVVLQVHGDGRVVIEHGDIPGVMKAMTMEFEVDPALLEGIEPGDRVEFRIADAGGRYRVTELAERP